MLTAIEDILWSMVNNKLQKIKKLGRTNIDRRNDIEGNRRLHYNSAET